jgi:hypothetical protein
MGYSEASRAGIKANGRRWRATIKGLPDALAALGKAIDEAEAKVGDCTPELEAAHAAMRRIGAMFRPHWDEEEASSSETEALEWFEQESFRYEFERFEHQSVRDNIDYYLRELYDWADYNRVWVAPDWGDEAREAAGLEPRP